MTILLGCDKGLYQLGASLHKLPCPLERITHMTRSGKLLAAADDISHQLWLGEHVWPIETGLEALALWHGRCLMLSGDTDCLTLLDADTGQPIIVTPVGVYPQDLCLLEERGLLAVAGGSDGTLRLLSLDELHEVHTATLPGAVQRVAAEHAGGLLVLCLTEDDGLQCLLCRLQLFSLQYEVIARLPGLPGAVQTDGRGGIWAAASEYLYHFAPREKTADIVLPHVGLIRSILPGAGGWLVTDPVMEWCGFLHPSGTLKEFYRGAISQALWAHTEK